MNILDNLNDKQKEAVEITTGPCLVIAGAGSGKTKVLTHKIAYLIDHENLKPYEILAITFTNKAANEMKERINGLIGDVSKDLWMGTFHSVCVRILRKFIHKIGFENSFLIFDTADQKTLIKTCLNELNIDDKLFSPKLVQSAISNAKNSMIDAVEYSKRTNGEYRKEKISEIYTLYQQKLKEYNALDFDDLINFTIQLFEENEEVLEYYVNKFKYVLVDEYQDTNKAQFKLISLLSRQNNITVVGDPEQGIYSFRGADISNILNFEHNFKDSKVVKLEQNYRCSQNILDIANEVIKNNEKCYEKVLWTENGIGSKPEIFRGEDEYGETQHLVEKIKQMVDDGTYSYKDFAVLYRINTLSRVIEDMMVREGIPYKIVGGLKFYERKEIKDSLAFLRIIENSWDSISLRRIINEPKKGIGKTTLDTMESFAKENKISMYDVVKDADKFGYNKAFLNTRVLVDTIEYLKENKDKLPLSEIFDKILENSGYMAMLKAEKTIEADNRIDNIHELYNVICEFEREEAEPTLAKFLETVSLTSDLDKLDDTDDCVTLMTLHSAKGLEFKNVFLIALEEGIFPSAMAREDEKQIEEERRLCYVGITRAKENLFISFAKRRTTYGKTIHNMHSRFLNEISPDKVEGYDYVLTSEVVVREEMQILRSNERAMQKMQKADNNLFKFKTATEFLTNLEKQKEATVFQATNIHDLREGQQVYHKKFGNGVISFLEPEGNDIKVDIEFQKYGAKRLMAKYANLKIIS